MRCLSGGLAVLMMAVGPEVRAADDPPVIRVEVTPLRPENLVYVGEPVRLDATASFDPDGEDLVRFEWQLNGKTVSDERVFRWMPEASGGARQEISLKICDQNGLCSGDVRVYKVSPVSRRFYYVKDHIGSVRVTLDEFGNVVHYSDYYPFGMEMPGRVLENESPAERFTGHYRDDESGFIYAGARFYDPKIARWLTPDPLATEYPGWSPYNYALGDPVGNFDPDGNYVVFINGWYTQWYTRVHPAAVYWKGFDNEIMKYFDGEGHHYADGSLGGAFNSVFMYNNQKLHNVDSGNRFTAGYNAGRSQAAFITEQLGEGETVKIVSHSMGGAYGIGYARALADEGVSVEFHLAIAPFKAGGLSTDGVRTFQVGDEDDLISGIPDIPGAITLRKQRVHSRFGLYKNNLNPALRHLIRDYDPQDIMRELEARLYFR